MTEFSKDDEWTKEKITLVSQKTGLSESQVYKWCWDQKKKNACKGGEGKENIRADLFEENLHRINTVKEKAELLERLGKRKAFGSVNDYRVSDSHARKRTKY